MVLFGQYSLLAHICSSNKLNTEIVAKYLRGGHLKWNSFLHSLEVLLVTVHDNVLFSSVVFLSELLTEGLNR